MHLSNQPFRRIAVIGSSGAGKSTLSRLLGDVTGLPVVHLDKEHWQPGWVEPDQKKLAGPARRVRATARLDHRRAIWRLADRATGACRPRDLPRLADPSLPDAGDEADRINSWARASGHGRGMSGEIRFRVPPLGRGLSPASAAKGAYRTRQSGVRTIWLRTGSEQAVFAEQLQVEGLERAAARAPLLAQRSGFSSTTM